VTEFFQFAYQGLVLGAVYALIALGFVIVYKSSEVINFAHGELVLLGGSLVFFWRNQIEIPFVFAVLLAMIMMAGVGLGIERVVLRRMVGRPVFAIVMITIGLAIVVRQVVTSAWGFADRHINDPFGATVYDVGGLRVSAASLGTIGATAAVLLGFFLFFRMTKAGVAMRAAAFDQEAALSLGISVRRMTAIAWAIAGATAAIAGVFISSFPGSLSPTTGFIALRAFPAAILGGLDSPGGAVIGGVTIGLIEVLMQGYQPRVAPWLGNNFHVIAAYAVMVVVLMIRPYGLFGTREVERV